MRSVLKLLIAILACLLLIPAAASAGGGKGGGHDRDRDYVLTPIPPAEFLTLAAQGNRFEILTGELAQQRAASPEIRAMGAMLVRDHTALQAQGDAVAAALRITVPPGLDPRAQAIADRLATLSGEDFDRAWLRAQLWAHETALLLHLRGAIRGEAPEIRTLAQGALPVITHHLAGLLDLAEAARGDHDHDADDSHSSRGGDKHRGHHRGHRHDSRQKARR